MTISTKIIIAIVSVAVLVVASWVIFSKPAQLPNPGEQLPVGQNDGNIESAGLRGSNPVDTTAPNDRIAPTGDNTGEISTSSIDEDLRTVDAQIDALENDNEAADKAVSDSATIE